jgi:uncharacterized oligopeptide transporter (OPT) family protein
LSVDSPGGAPEHIGHTTAFAKMPAEPLKIMPCLLLLVVLLFPRVVLVLTFLFSNYLQRAYDNLLIPLIGFIFLPITTLAYAWIANSRQPIEGIYLIVLIVAVIIDIGGLGGGEYHRRRR